MEFQVSRMEQAHVITLAGRLDTFSAAAFEQGCSDLVRQGARRIIIDLARVDYVSSFGLRSLLNLGKLLEPLRGTVLVCSLQPQVHKIFTGSGFDSLFPEFADVHAAMQACGDTP